MSIRATARTMVIQREEETTTTAAAAIESKWLEPWLMSFNIANCMIDIEIYAESKWVGKIEVVVVAVWYFAALN